MGQWLKLAFGFPFLDPAEVEDSFVEDWMPQAPNDERAEMFSDYVLNNYILDSAKFPPIMWAEIPSTVKRTNNGAEAFHSHFNRQFYSCHPTIFVFLDVLTKTQTNTYIQIRGIYTEERAIRKAEREKHSYMMEQFRRFTNGECTRLNFVKSMGYKFSANTNL